MAETHQPAMAETHQAENKEDTTTPEEGESLAMSTLPTREGWWVPFLCFQGCWMPPQRARSVHFVQAQFKPRPDDTILATHPKCGTTWLKALAFAVANRGRRPVVTGGGGHPLLTHNPHDLVPYLEMPSRDLRPISELEALPSPRLLSSHLPLALLPSGTLALGCRIVYLCRDPKDVLVSLWYHVHKVLQGSFSIELEEAFEMFCDGFSFFGPIWEHYLGYWKESIADPDRVLFLKYDEMMAEPARHVKMLAEFLGVPFTDDELGSGAVEEVVRLCSFENLRNLPVNSHGVASWMSVRPAQNSLFFRSAKVGDWANHFTKEMAQKLDGIVEEKLKGSGLSF